MSAIRICAEEGCVTRLSRYNSGSTCWMHTKVEAPIRRQLDPPATTPGATRKRRQRERARQGTLSAQLELLEGEGQEMSEAFLAGIPERLNAAERRRVKNEAWL